MTRSSAPRRDFAAMQERRRRAGRLFAAGKRSQADGRLSGEKAAERMQAAVSGLSQIFEWTHVRPDGTTFLAEVSLNRGLTPEAGHLQAIIHDITERKQAEESLLFKTALLEAQSETTIDGMLVVDESDHVVLANKQFGLHFEMPDEVLSSGDDRVLRKYVIGQVESPDAFIEIGRASCRERV